MATTLATEFRRGNYCTLPTIDVEIITDKTVHCLKCGSVLINDDPNSIFSKWRHQDPALDDDHRADRMARCHYCGGEGTTTHGMHAWHDSSDCSRCGGSYGFPLGD